jgi:membrane-associated protein
MRAALSGRLEDLLADSGGVLFCLAVWGLVFIGTAFFVGLVLPFLTGDSLLFGAGIVAGTFPDRVSIVVLAIGVGVAAVAGDQVGYVLGRRYGRAYLLRRRRRSVRIAVEKTERFSGLFGWWSVVIGRYIPWGRVLVPPVAGVADMAWWRFVTANLVGALSWGVLITVIGFLAATEPAVRPIAYAIAGVMIAASIVAGVRAWRSDRASSRVAEEA